MGLFQSMYDWIKNIKTPAWLKAILQELQDIMVEVALQIGKDMLSRAQAKVIELSKSGLTNEEKIREFSKFMKKEIPGLKDSYINLLREVIVVRFKASFLI